MKPYNLGAFLVMLLVLAYTLTIEDVSAEVNNEQKLSEEYEDLMYELDVMVFSKQADMKRVIQRDHEGFDEYKNIQEKIASLTMAYQVLNGEKIHKDKFYESKNENLQFHKESERSADPVLQASIINEKHRAFQYFLEKFDVVHNFENGYENLFAKIELKSEFEIEAPSASIELKQIKITSQVQQPLKKPAIDAGLPKMIVQKDVCKRTDGKMYCVQIKHDQPESLQYYS